MAIIIRDFEQKDKESVRELLYSAGFKHLETIDKWHWQFHSGCGEPVIKVAEDTTRNLIVGHYGMIPLNFYYMGKCYNGGKIEGSVVHPEYRGVRLLKHYPEMADFRLFKELVDSLIRELASLGKKICFGFPNGAAKKTQYEGGYAPADYKYVLYRMILNPRYYVNKDFSKRNIFRRLIVRVYLEYKRLFFKKHKVPFSCYVEEYDERKHDVEELFAAFSNAKRIISIDRNKLYLKWRYIDNPIFKNSIFAISDEKKTMQGMVVCGYKQDENGRVGNIFDIIYRTDDISLIAALLDAAIEHLKSKNVDVISSMVGLNNFSELHRSHQMLGFIKANRVQSNFFYVADTIGEGGDIKNIDNWYINYSFKQY